MVKTERESADDQEPVVKKTKTTRTSAASNAQSKSQGAGRTKVDSIEDTDSGSDSDTDANSKSTSDLKSDSDLDDYRWHSFDNDPNLDLVLIDEWSLLEGQQSHVEEILVSVPDPHDGCFHSNTHTLQMR